MAVDTFNVTPQDVLDVISAVDTRIIQQSTGRVSRDKIEGWIDDFASEMSGILEKAANLDAADLSDESEKQVQRAIKHGAAAQTLQKLGHTGDLYAEHNGIWEDTRDRLEESPERLDRQVSRADSTIDHTDTDSDYIGTDFKL